jgi:predicted lipoprotein with Yx(FWY)xxD motif
MEVITAWGDDRIDVMAMTDRAWPLLRRLAGAHAALLLAALGVAALTMPGLAEARGTRAKLALRKTTAGKILVDGAGYTVYEFAKDRRNKDVCVNISGCLEVWPALTTNGKAQAGRGVKSSLIGTITLPGGVKQVTYAGHPLYTYIVDGAPGDATGIATYQSLGYWYGLTAAGHLVR